MRWKIPFEHAFPTHDILDGPPSPVQRAAGSALALRPGRRNSGGAGAPRAGSAGTPTSSAPRVDSFGPQSYWMSSPSEARPPGVQKIWHKAGGYDLPDSHDL